MEKLVINSYDEFAAHLGQELGTSEWLEVTQERIHLFADATLDHQWIHVDTERCKTEVPELHEVDGRMVACHRAEELHLRGFNYDEMK